MTAGPVAPAAARVRENRVLGHLPSPEQSTSDRMATSAHEAPQICLAGQPKHRPESRE
jgi:hypothetical protein